jgi:hypothetical protein
MKIHNKLLLIALATTAISQALFAVERPGMNVTLPQTAPA